MATFRPNTAPKYRWLYPHYGGNAVATNNQASGTAGRHYLQLFDVAAPVTVDAIVLLNGTTAAGNVTAMIYGPLVTEEDCTGAPLAVASSSVAQTGTSVPQIIPLADTVLMPGRYYVGIEFSDVTGTFLRSSSTSQVTGWAQTYDRGGGYGAPTNPAPACTNSSVNCPLRVRCKA
jgi:hypothetical protein